MVYQAQQPPTGFDPTQGGYNWQQARPEMTPEELQAYQSGLKTDPVLDFFHKHPHIIKALMERMEVLITGVVERVFVSSGLLGNQLDLVQASRQARPNDPRSNAWNSIEKMTTDAIARGTPGMVPTDMANPASPKRPQNVVETMDFESEAFFKLLTEQHKSDLLEMNRQNDQWALEKGVYWQDANSGATYSPFAVNYETGTGQWAQQNHTGNQWGQPGLPPQAPQMQVGQSTSILNNPYAGALFSFL